MSHALPTLSPHAGSDHYALVEAEIASSPIGHWFLAEVKRRAVSEVEERLHRARRALLAVLAELGADAEGKHAAPTPSPPAFEARGVARATPAPVIAPSWPTAPQSRNPPRCEHPPSTQDRATAPIGHVSRSAQPSKGAPDTKETAGQSRPLLPRLDRIAGQIASAVRQREEQPADVEPMPLALPTGTSRAPSFVASPQSVNLSAKSAQLVTPRSPMPAVAEKPANANETSTRWSVQDLLARATREFDRGARSRLDFSEYISPDLSQFLWRKLLAKDVSGDEYMALPQTARDVLLGARHAYQFGDLSFRGDANDFVADFEKGCLLELPSEPTVEHIELIRTCEGRTYMALLFVLGRHGLKLK